MTMHLYDEDGFYTATIYEHTHLYADTPRWTGKPLPESPPTHRNRMTESGEWELVADYRGRVFHDPATRQTHTISTIGEEPLPEWVDGLPPPTDAEELAAQRATLYAQLAALRYQVETGGTLLGGVRILTGRTDQTMTTQAFVTLQSGMVDGIDWKGPEGWRRVTLAELEPVARAVAAHVQRCFSTERVVSEQIAVVDPQTFDLSAAWATAWSATV